jgi:regulator of G-protein signaling
LIKSNFQIESLLERMEDENTGLPIKSVKSFMSKIPSVLTGGDLIQWILRTLDVDDTSISSFLFVSLYK